MTTLSPISNPVQLLVIEDDAVIAGTIAAELELEGYSVHVERNGQSGLTAALERQPDLIVLDRMLPGIDGMEICRRLRQSSDIPIIMLTALNQPEDRIAGLNLGANDCLGKPFLLQELIARIRVHLRTHQPPVRNVLAFADVTLDIAAHEVRRGPRLVPLTPKEFDLLQYLLRHPRQAQTRDRIVDAVWGPDYDGDRNIVDVYIRYVRSKLEAEDEARLIHTLRGVGYILREGEPDGRL